MSTKTINSRKRLVVKQDTIAAVKAPIANQIVTKLIVNISMVIKIKNVINQNIVILLTYLNYMLEYEKVKLNRKFPNY